MQGTITIIEDDGSASSVKVNLSVVAVSVNPDRTVTVKTELRQTGKGRGGIDSATHNITATVTLALSHMNVVLPMHFYSGIGEVTFFQVQKGDYTITVAVQNVKETSELKLNPTIEVPKPTVNYDTFDGAKVSGIIQAQGVPAQQLTVQLLGVSYTPITVSLDGDTTTYELLQVPPGGIRVVVRTTEEDPQLQGVSSPFDVQPFSTQQRPMSDSAERNAASTPRWLGLGILLSLGYLLF